MSEIRQLNIDFESIAGGFDDRKDWTAEFKVAGPTDVSKDEDIARRLQMEEENTFSQRNISPTAIVPDWKDYDDRAQRHHAEAQRRNADIKRKEAEQALQNERTDRARLERDRQYEREQQNIRRINEYNNLAVERAALRASYPSSIYDRLYNWSLTLLPDYYDYVQRQQLRKALSHLIRRELHLQSPESDLEEKIKLLIREGESKAKSAPRSRSKARAKPKPKPRAKSKAKPRSKSKK